MIEKLFRLTDQDKKGYIDEECAKGSSKMIALIKRLRKVTGKTKGKIYLSDIIDSYSKGKNQERRTGKICDSFLEMMTERITDYKYNTFFLKTDLG